MERKFFTLTERQMRKCASVELPSDDEFKAIWMQSHHGKAAGWGMGKRDWIISNMRMTPEYQRGIWQARVDLLNGLDYSEERIDSAYNLGYWTGWDEGSLNRFRREAGAAVFAEFVAAYGPQEVTA